MRKANRTSRLAVIAILSICAPAVCAADPGSEFLETRIRPVLVKRCFSCHTSGHMGGLEMSGRNVLLKGGGRGPAISVDHPEDSLLLKAVRCELDALKMPPSGKLPENEIDDLTVWVKAGAVWPESPKAAVPKGPYAITTEQRAFWAFQPVRKPALPGVKDARWAKSAIDQLLHAKRETQELEPVEPADKTHASPPRLLRSDWIAAYAEGG